MDKKFKVAFDLDEKDAAYFRDLYKQAKVNAAKLEPDTILKDARKLIEKVRTSEHVPRFVLDAIQTLEDMTQIILDEEYRAPQPVKNQVLAGLAYFANAEDLIPDHVPALGFLDDAIMVKFIEEEFKNELWGYRRFRKLRDSSEQRPWSAPASDRLRQRLESDRRRVRAEIEERDAKDEAKRKSGRSFGW
jgi:uncharacterized membrane protein YkvA (DUF1232 family)